MALFSLTKKLENTILIEGVEYTVDLSFNTVIQFYELLEDDNLQSFEKVVLAFDMFLPQVNSDPFTIDQKQQAIEDIREYIQASPYGNEPPDEGTDSESFEEKAKNFSYSQDAGAIYASFIQDYGIDLLQQKGKMHFLTFKALLDGLSDKTYFQRVVGIREESITDKEGEALTSLLEAQSYYALEENKTVNQLDNQLGDMFAMLKTQAQTGKEEN